MSRKPKVTILYEDARGQQLEFGLHRLVLSAVLDREGVSLPYYELAKAIEHRCQKGVERVLSVCREDLEKIAGDGRKVAVVVDDDVIRDKVQLPASATIPDVAETIRALCPESVRAQVAVYVLSRNTESVIKAARDCVKEHRLDSPTEEQIQRALSKDRLARDQVLSGVTKDTHAKVRSCIEKKVPGLGELVIWLSGIVSTPS
jgi:hypothetical protein